MKVRVAVPDDAPAITALHVRAWQVTYAGTIPGGYLMSMDVESRIPGRRASIETVEPPAAIFVAADEQDIRGFAHVGPYRSGDSDPAEPTVGEIYAIYVHPSHWSTGTGLALMRVAVAHLTEAGFTEIRLWVLDANPRARRFYERYGLTLDGAEKMFTVAAGGRYETQVRVVRYTLPVR